MSQESNIECVERALDSFISGDIDAVIDSMAEDVVFLPSGPAELLPWAKPRKGRDEVREYFTELLRVLDYHVFQVERFFAQDDEVLVLVRTRLMLRSNRQVFDADVALRFTLRHGKIAKYQDYSDTATAVAALAVEGSSSNGRLIAFTQPFSGKGQDLNRRGTTATPANERGAQGRTRRASQWLKRHWLLIGRSRRNSQ